MVKKVAELRSLNELNLSSRTRSYLENNFNSIDDIVKEGRIDAFEQECGIQSTSKAPKWELELVSALREAGFIRPAEDFILSFNVATLYAKVSEPTYGKDLPDYHEEFTTKIEQLSNTQYEAFCGLAKKDIERVMSYLDAKLPEKEIIILCQRYGLHGENAKDLEEVGCYMNTTREHIRQIEAKALRRLKFSKERLPKVFDAPIEMNEIAETLNAELEELYKSPAFMRANEIVKELKYMKELPFRYTCQCLRDDTSDQTHIGELGLGPRAYTCLIRAGINTISDIINLPKEDWHKIRNLGVKSLQEVVEKMHLFGYEDFDV